MNNANPLKSAAIPSLFVSAICIAIFAATRNSPGALGALLGSATVIIFLSIHLVIQAVSKNLDPIAVMALAMFSYFAKVAIMGAFLLVVAKITSPKTVDRPSFAVAALLITVIWLAAEIRAFLRLRPQLPLPKSGS